MKSPSVGVRAQTQLVHGHEGGLDDADGSSTVQPKVG
jgi:hypothetical protein